MNKNLYRIIFNANRGQRMAVAETARGQGKAAAGESCGGGAGGLAGGLMARLHPLRFAVLSALGMVCAVLPLVHAQIIADPNAPSNQQPTILNTANGLPLVNIQTPSAAGVSRNSYSQFDVNRPGAVLNNSRTNVQTQLGGFTPGNPWLAGGSARVILNEVNSSNPSQIRGYVEVAGRRAEVIIANPAGVNVDGGGFINASRVTLTTGSPVLNGGALEAFRVQGGNITVGGAGLDTSSADYTGILARAVQVNAGIWAKELRVTTGANEIDAGQTSATPIAGTGPAPTYAIDVAQIGGMYAGKIFLIGTETGLGVRNAGVIQATGASGAGGDLVLLANGWLTNSGSLQAAGSTQVNTLGAIANSGTVYASGNTTLTAQGDISNAGTGVIAAQGHTTLQATGAGAQISSAAGSVVAAGLNPDGTLTSGGNLGVAATGAVSLNGQSVAGGNASISGTQVSLADGKLSGQNISLAASTGNIDASRATLNGQGTLSASAAQTLRTDGAVVSAKQLDLAAQDLSNAGGEIVQTGTGNTTIALTSGSGTLNNTSGRIATNSQNLTLSAPTLLNTDGKIEHAGSGTLAINATTFSGDRGTIAGSGALNLSATTVSHNSASLSADRVTVAAATLSNRSGAISQTGAGAGSVTTSGALDNTAGKIIANGNTTVSALSLNNQGGVIQATGASNLGISTHTALDNSASGQIAAGGAATLNIGTLNNSKGKVTAGTSLTASATGAMANTQGLIAANGAVTLTAASLDNTLGTVASVQNNVSATTTGATVNDSGRIEAAGDVTLANTGLANTKAAGQASAGSITGRSIGIQTNGQGLDNAFGTIAAAQGATLQTGALNNHAGLIQAGAALGINTNGQALTNTNAAAYASGAGGITSQAAMTLNTGDLNNAAGFIGAKAALNASAAAVGNTAAGQIVGESSVNFTSTAFDNRGGQVQAVGDAGINVGAGTVNNAGGLIRSAATTTLNAGSVLNSNTLGANQGIEGNNVAITASAIANDLGAIRADNNVTLTSSGTLNNNAGLISASNTATVQDTAASRTLAITNAAGTLIAGQSAAISAASASGNGKLLSRGALNMALTSDFNNTGEVIANGNATVTTSGNITNSGKLQAGGTLDVSATNIDNAATGEITGATTKVTASNTLTNRGLIDGQNTQVNATTLNNLGTGRIYGDTLGIAATTLNNDAETVGGVTKAAVIAARDRLDIGANVINNGKDALIFSAGTGAAALNIGGSLDSSRQATGYAGSVNNSGGTIESLGGLSIAAALINNTNPDFAYTVQSTPGVQVREYITAQGIYNTGDIAWELGSLTPAAHGGYLYPTGKGRFLPKGETYSQAVYAPYYSGPDAYVAEHNITVGSGDSATSVHVPPAFGYASDHPVWGVFGITPPGTAMPGPRPTGTYVTAGDSEIFIPPTPAELAAWEAAVAPWVALQTKINAFKASVNASAIAFDGFRDYNQAVPSATITQSTSGRILSAGAMTLNASTALLNDQSQIIAGGALSVPGQALENRGRSTTVNVQRNGLAYAWSHYDHGCGSWDGCDYEYDAYRDSAYVQDVPQTLTLNVYRKQDMVSPASQGLATGTQLTGAVIGNVSSNTSAAGVASAAARSAGIIQVTSSVANVGGVSASMPVVRTSMPNLGIPNTSLFRTNPSPTSAFLIETDPRFASYRNWLGSDYMLQTLSLDPTVTQKRLGDGFYEQRLIREQVALLTGQRFVASYVSDAEQYKGLMDAGVTYAQQWNLRPGIALTAEQMARLTSDIVWLVEQEVTLPDGRKTKALVPQVYVRVQPGDIDGAGTLLAGREININLSGDLTNTGTVAGRKIVNLTAENVQNLGGRITGEAVTVAARSDLNNIGGTIDAANSLVAVAGRDLNIVTTTSSAANQVGGNTFSHTGIDRVAGLYVSKPGGTLVASAGRDANIIAGIIANSGQGGSSVISAGNNINLGSITTASSSYQGRGEDDFLRDSQSRDVGSQIQTTGNLSLIAGNDLNAKAASVQAGGALTASAGNNVNITAGQSTNSFGFGLTTSESDLFGSTSTKERRTSDQTNAVGSSLGGSTVTVVSGSDINVKGSAVISDAGTTLVAGRNITIEAAQNTSSSSSFFEKKESGLLDGGGIGITVGTREQSTDQKDRNTTAAASTVGSIGGNVTLVANEGYKQVGSDVMAPNGDITILAKKVDIIEARETSRSDTEQKFKQSGLTLEITSPVLSALQTIDQMSQAASNTSDGRMQGLAAANGAFAARNALKAIEAGQGSFMNGKEGQIATGGKNPDGSPASRDATDADKVGGINLAISIGSSSSQSNSTSRSDTARGSTITAGGNVNIAATGAGQNSNLTIQGSTVEAGRAVQLLADNQVKLLAAQNTASQNSTNSNSSGSIGISFGTDGLLLNLSASKGKGRADGTDTFYTNTQIKGGDQVSITSGGDTTLQGAVVKADQVKANVGGNLNIQSLQDTSTYTSEQKSMGGSLSVGAGKVSGSISVSNSNINSDFKSVAEQSGIKAGDGGFQVNVSGNTNLNGSVIASTDKAVTDGKNTFSTGGALTLSDIQNTASYEGKSAGISIGAGQQQEKLGMSGVGVGIGSGKGNANSTSTAGISGIAGNTAVRSTDAETGLQKIFDADKVQREINAQTQITQYFGQQATRAVGDYAQTKLNEAVALRDQANNESNEERKNALKVQATELEDNWGSSGVLRVALHTVIGGLTGGVGGAAGAASGTLTAPMVAQALADAGIGGPLAQTLTTIASTAVGAAAGGTAGGATAANEVVNNYLSHDEATKRQMLKDKQRKGQPLSDAEQKTLDDLEVLDIVRDLALRDACKVQGDACNMARRGLNAALGTYSGAAAMLDPRLSPIGNAGVKFDRNYALSLGNEPNLAAQTLLDSFKEFALPQVGGYLAGAALGAYVNEARAIYIAIQADRAVVNATIAQEVNIIRSAINGKGNFNLGLANAEQSNRLGQAWVGEGATLASDGTTFVSADKLRQYRPPTNKSSPYAVTGTQSNFQSRDIPEGAWQSNGHLNITGQ